MKIKNILRSIFPSIVMFLKSIHFHKLWQNKRNLPNYVKKFSIFQQEYQNSLTSLLLFIVVVPIIDKIPWYNIVISCCHFLLTSFILTTLHLIKKNETGALSTPFFTPLKSSSFYFSNKKYIYIYKYNCLIRLINAGILINKAL